MRHMALLLLQSLGTMKSNGSSWDRWQRIGRLHLRSYQDEGGMDTDYTGDADTDDHDDNGDDDFDYDED